MYLTLDDYNALYEPIDERSFNRFSLEACRLLDVHTSGVDNVKKLKVAFPTDEEDARAVKHCAARLVNFLYSVYQAEAALVGYEVTANGLRGKVITSLSSGNESISYTVGSSAVDSAAKDINVRNKMIAEIIWDYLTGITDSNGINLLYMGRYPRGYLC